MYRNIGDGTGKARKTGGREFCCSFLKFLSSFIKKSQKIW
jgi:hypothetical protein